MKTGLLSVLLLIGFACFSRAEEAKGRALSFDLGVTFTLPRGWMVLKEPAAAVTGTAPALLFYARPDDPSFLPGLKANDAWISVSRLPASSADAGAEETNALAQVLTQEGCRIAESAAGAGVGGASSARFYCYSQTGPPIIVEVSRWVANGEAVAVQIRYSEAIRADLKQDIERMKGSFRRNGQTTFAFGVGPPPETVAAAASSAPAPSVAASPSPPPPITTEQLATDLAGGLVFIEGAKKSGSGFICTLEKQKCLITNIHVIDGNKNPRFTLLDGSQIQTGNAFAAVDHDVISLATSAGKAMEVMRGVEQNVAVGDEVVVLGNKENERIVNPIEGTVAGIAPNLVEITAVFRPGNNGSPVIHKKTGKVIGIAAYSTTESVVTAGQAAPHRVVRRFAYRLDSITKWQPITWAEFYVDSDKINDIKALTRDLETFRREFSSEDYTPGRYAKSAVQSPVADYIRATTLGHMSAFDRQAAKKDLLFAVRAAARSDMPRQPLFTYDYFQREFQDQQRARDAFIKFFDTQSSPR